MDGNVLKNIMMFRKNLYFKNYKIFRFAYFIVQTVILIFATNKMVSDFIIILCYLYITFYQYSF